MASFCQTRMLYYSNCLRKSWKYRLLKLPYEEDYQPSKPENEIEQIVNRVIHYIEYDA